MRAFESAEDAAAAVARPGKETKAAPKRLLLMGWNPRMPDLLEQIDEVLSLIHI